MSEGELQAVLKKARTDARFFEDLFTEPEKALKAAGFSPDLATTAPPACGTLTCGWSCQWTGAAKNAEPGKSEAGCGLTCDWSCAWTAATNIAGKNTENCGSTCGLSCAYTDGKTSEGGKQDLAKIHPECGRSCDVSCTVTCAKTNMKMM
jgi:hypothetical protein